MGGWSGGKVLEYLKSGGGGGSVGLASLGKVTWPGYVGGTFLQCVPVLHPNVLRSFY